MNSNLGIDITIDNFPFIVFPNKHLINIFIQNQNFEQIHTKSYIIFECVIIVWIFKVLLDNLLRIYKQIPKNTEISNIRKRLGANNSLGKSYYSSHKSSVMKHFILAKNK